MNVITSLPTDARARAEQEQLQASDPEVSAFVSASAGSGKTKLLTDRMLRLMLGGADPSRIQCLTFTKAAAAEMSLRLQRRLGEWVTRDDDALDRDLLELRVDPTDAARAKARELFATVLDLPGGMRIGTIHAFCQSLLRRFPVEAAISPHFRLVEDTDARQAMDQAREGVLATTPPEDLRDLAGLANAERFAALVSILEGQRARLGPALTLADPRLEAAMRRVAGASGATDGAILAAAIRWDQEPALTAALRSIAEQGSPAVKLRADGMLGWLGLDAGLRSEHWAEWLKEFADGSGNPRKFGAFPNAKLAEKQPELRDALHAEQERVMSIEDSRRALRVAEASTALLRLARPVLGAYAGRKRDMGFLDYGDLISLTSGLLLNPGAAWVLYKLDGGIDHLLLDEVQDTAPEQWQIAHQLTEEFFAGQGARSEQVAGQGAPSRTFFAVGDPKQSIYSFQGADPEEFGRSHDRMAARVGGSAQEWRDVTLDVSFRSTAPVLALVDAVFADPLAARGVAEDGPLRHFADRAGFAGQVELWPLTPLPEEQAPASWTVPERNLGLVSAPQRLADALARYIGIQLQDGVQLQSRGRPLQAGDVLVLVRRRDAFARALVRALKARGVAVAGLDRLVLTEQAAVQDMLAACDAVLLPEDDLAVACVLTSPLGGLTDDSLMALAMGRRGTLWDALRDRAGERRAWQDAWDFLGALRARADYVTPHALLSEALGPLGGRARLLARLGTEAAEPLDELLNAALAYTATHPPALQGFVHWLRRSGAEVKREAEGAGAAVRVMTVHGAKGLQAPLVILPDTTALPPEDDAFHWVHDAATGADLPLWSPRKELRCAAVQQAHAAERDRRMREYNRLLYVALTRAEDRLLVCGWHTKRGVPADSWYRMAERGFQAIGAPAGPFSAVPGAWEGEHLMLSSEQVVQVPKSPAAGASAAADLPRWAGQPGDWRPAPTPPEPRLPVPLAPSRPDGASLGPVPRAASPLDQREDAGRRFLRGTLVHTLLQHLPDLREAEREQAALEYLGRPGFGLSWAEVRDLGDQVIGVLRHPGLAPLFGPAGRAEQPLAGLVGGTVVTGVVDRMAVLPDAVWVADYKTGRDAPASITSTPVRYLRQIAAYRAVLHGVFPGRPVRCALVWTQGATVAMLPDALLESHAPR